MSHRARRPTQWIAGAAQAAAAAASTSRERLLRPTTLALIFAAVAALLMLLFPRQDLTARRFNNKPDELAVAYLRLMLRGQPRSQRVRFALAEQLHGLGRLGEALDALDPLVDASGPTGMRARLRALAILHERYGGLAAGHPGRDGLARQIIARLRRLALDPLKTDDRLRLAKLALAFDQPLFAAQLYEKLAAQAKEERARWFAEAAKWYLAAGQADRAAIASITAYRTASSGANQLTRGIRALDTLLAANHGQRALQLATELVQRFPTSEALAQRAVTIALAQGDLDKARWWGRAWLALTDVSAAMLERQLELELAAGDLDATLKLAQRIATAKPGDLRARRQLARIAEWAGRPRTALPNWLWLVHRGSNEAAERAMALAQGLGERQTVAYLLSRQVATGELSDNQLAELVAVYEQLGQPAKAEAVLQRYLERHGQHARAWQLLAHVKQRSGDVKGALHARLAATQRFGPTFGVGPREAMQQARLLWRLDRPEMALAVLRAAKARADADHRRFWVLLGELAWQLEDNALALEAHRRIWRHHVRGDATEEDLELVALAMERIVLLSLENEQLDEAVRVSREAWKRFDKPHLLLLVMERMADLERWDRLRRLLQIVGDQQQRVRSYALYWRLQAELALHDRRFANAEAAYRRALILEPMSQAARLGWLWANVELGHRARVYRALRSWWKGAEADPAFWPVYGMLLDRLGRRHQALPWYAKRARQQPQQLELALDYADALRRAGKPKKAWKLRRRLLQRLRPQAVAALKRFAAPRFSFTRFTSDEGQRVLARYGADLGPRPLRPTDLRPGARGAEHLALREGRNVLLPYSELVRQFEGTARAENWLRPLLTYGEHDTAIQAFAVSWYLADNRSAQAQRWLARWQRADEHSTAPARLALAIASSDGDQAAALLEHERKLIPAAQQVGALVQLGRQDAAYRIARAALEQASDVEEREALRRSLAQLAERRAPRLTLDGGWQRFGPLHGFAETLALRLNLEAWTLHALLGRLDSESDASEALLARHYGWWNLAAELGYQQQPWSLELAGGVRLGTFGAQPSVRLATGYALVPDLRLRVEGAWNEASEESAALRVAGRQSRVAGSVALSLPVLDGIDLSANVAWRQFTDSQRNHLGHGYTTELVADQRFVLGPPIIRLGLSGSLSGNAVAETLPAGFTTVVPAGTPPDAVLPARFASAGLRIGISQQDSTGLKTTGLGYHGDLWVGWTWPDNRPAYRLDLGLDWRFVWRHRISTDFTYASQQGLSGQDFLTFLLRYSYLFG